MIDTIEKDCQTVVEIPDAVIENANPLWEDFLIGKFLDLAPHIAKVHAIVNKIWTQGESSQRIEVFEVDSTTMKFRISNSMLRARILRRGMWNIANIPLVVTKWTPDELKEKLEVKSIPLWVYLKNVPMNMFSWQGLSFIASSVGSLVRLHPETASCSNFEVVKIFVNADLSKELPTKINFTKNGKSSLVEFSYPWLPLRCHTCRKWGHVEKSCVRNKNDGIGLSDQIKMGLELNMKGKEKESVEEAVIENTDAKIEEGQIEEGWSEVKSNHSPTKRMLAYGQVKLLTPSRFMVLNEITENGDFVNVEKQDDIVEGGSKEENEMMQDNSCDVDLAREDENIMEDLEVISNDEVKKESPTKDEGYIMEVASSDASKAGNSMEEVGIKSATK